jgi:hypothetical protein
VIDNPDAYSSSLKLYTEAPAPDSLMTDATRIADPAAPAKFTFTVVDNRDGTGELLPKEIRFAWNYLNTLGGVPERDDVRFHLAFREVQIPLAGGDSQAPDYPSVEQTIATAASQIAGDVFADGDTIIIKDISFKNHKKWTDPLPTTSPRQYEVSFPVSPGKRYLIRLLPKRFCFDQSEIKYSSRDHVFAVDVKE